MPPARAFPTGLVGLVERHVGFRERRSAPTSPWPNVSLGRRAPAFQLAPPISKGKPRCRLKAQFRHSAGSSRSQIPQTRRNPQLDGTHPDGRAGTNCSVPDEPQSAKRGSRRLTAVAANRLLATYPSASVRLVAEKDERCESGPNLLFALISSDARLFS